MSKPYDIRNDPKFAARVKKLEGNKFSKVLKAPLLVDIAGEQWYVAAIGLNDSYMIVRPRVDHESFTGFSVVWTKSDGFNKPTSYHEAVSMTVLNWMMLHADETSFNKRKHFDVKLVETAIETCSKVVGQAVMAKAGSTFVQCYVQGVLREDIKNPYHK